MHCRGWIHATYGIVVGHAEPPMSQHIEYEASVTVFTSNQILMCPTSDYLILNIYRRLSICGDNISSNRLSSADSLIKTDLMHCIYSLR